MGYTVFECHFYYTETVLEKDKAETERIVKGIVAREIQSDNESLKQKLEETGLKAKAQEEQVRYSIMIRRQCNFYPIESYLVR